MYEMDIFIDNKSFGFFGLQVLDATQLFSFASERANSQTWADKSGIDKNLVNIRYDVREFTISFVAKAEDEAQAYQNVKGLVDYMFQVGCFVLSARDVNIRQSFLCERSSTIVPSINIRQQNTLYYCKIGFSEVNPNALKYTTDIINNAASIYYTKGQTAVIYWGDGTKDEVSNSGTYTKTDYTESSGPIAIIIDVDANAADVDPLAADFEATPSASGSKEFTVTFNDLSVGNVYIWSWDFGDGNTSSEQNPTHVYTESGVYTVTLQIFNTSQGSDIEKKIDYIVVVPKMFDIDDTATEQIEVDDLGEILLIN